MSNDNVGKTEPIVEDIEVQHATSSSEMVQEVKRRKTFSVLRFFIMLIFKIERDLFVSLILVSVSLDPLFFYISVINNDSNCLGLDNNLRNVVVVLRTSVDGLYFMLWIHKLDSLYKNRCRRMLSWIAAILAILPLPQVIVYAISWQLLTVKLLKFVVIIQFVPRVYLIIPSYLYARERSFRNINMWAAAAFYLFMFILAANVLGAFWYLGAIERNMDCWRRACKTRGLCGVSSFYCDATSSNNGYLDAYCPIPPVPNSTFFDHGIYLDAFQRDIMGIHTNFLDKFFYCFWWGLQSLSSFGQNLDPGTYIWDTIFAAFIVVSGLILFALLIGNMQVYLQKTTTTELDKDRMMKDIKKAQMKIEIKCWPPFYSLPRQLRKEVISCEDIKWLGTTEINLESLLKNTPLGLRKDLRQHLCKDIFSRVEKFEQLAPQVKKQLRIRAKAVVFQAKSIIHKEGYPIHEMIHIVRGKAFAFSKDSNKKEESQWHAYDLRKNETFGKELLDKAFEYPSPNLPLAIETVQSLTKVEAFALSFDNIVDVLNRYGCLSISSQENWAANVIVNAIRRRAAITELAKPSHRK